MKIKNKAFWEKKEIINTQDKIKNASIYERFLFKTADDRLNELSKIKSVNIYGCGTGRDIKVIDDYFNPDVIVASDISENMIKGCLENMKEWDIQADVKTYVANAVDFDAPKDTFELVTLLNSMLTYVALRENRLEIFNNAYNSLKQGGVVVGTVHNQVGRPIKTWYFKLRGLFSFILKEKVGNKLTGFNGYKIPGYYYNKKWLIKDLNQTGYKDIEVYSLEEFFSNVGKAYDKNKGYNQLIFVATK